VEEAEASPQTLSEAQELIVMFAKGANSSDDWDSLSVGPFGDDLIQTGWRVYATEDHARDLWLANTIAALAGKRATHLFRSPQALCNHVIELLNSEDCFAIGRGLLVSIWTLWKKNRDEETIDHAPLKHLILRCLFDPRPPIGPLAAWAWGLMVYNQDALHYSPESDTLDHLLSRWLNDSREEAHVRYAFALQTAVFAEPLVWKPRLSSDQVKVVRAKLVGGPTEHLDESRDRWAALFVAYHHKGVASRAELARIARSLPLMSPRSERSQQRFLRLLGVGPRKGRKANH
jgi:hypothetical protein